MKAKWTKSLFSLLLALALLCSLLLPSAAAQRKLGDLDGNGLINSRDALLVLQYCVHLIKLDAQQIEAADADQNDKINSGDALTILKVAVGLIDEPTRKPATQKPTSAEPKVRKYVAFTFDDGPNTGAYVRLLDLAENKGAHFTFFLVGSYIQDSHKNILQRTVNLGCELGNHSFSHQRMGAGTAFASDPSLGVLDVQRCSDRIAELIGDQHRPVVYRDPLLDSTPAVPDAIHMPIIHGCNLYSGIEDWNPQDVNNMVDKLLYDDKGNLKIQNGDIFLLHAIQQSTVDATEIMMDILAKEGFAFVTVSELFALNGVSPSVRKYNNIS